MCITHNFDRPDTRLTSHDTRHVRYGFTDAYLSRLSPPDRPRQRHRRAGLSTSYYILHTRAHTLHKAQYHKLVHARTHSTPSDLVSFTTACPDCGRVTRTSTSTHSLGVSPAPRRRGASVFCRGTYASHLHAQRDECLTSVIIITRRGSCGGASGGQVEQQGTRQPPHAEHDNCMYAAH